MKSQVNPFCEVRANTCGYTDRPRVLITPQSKHYFYSNLMLLETVNYP